jgi:hypothetical protein
MSLRLDGLRKEVNDARSRGVVAAAGYLHCFNNHWEKSRMMDERLRSKCCGGERHCFVSQRISILAMMNFFLKLLLLNSVKVDEDKLEVVIGARQDN